MLFVYSIPRVTQLGLLLGGFQLTWLDKSVREHPRAPELVICCIGSVFSKLHLAGSLPVVCSFGSFGRP